MTYFYHLGSYGTQRVGTLMLSIQPHLTWQVR